MTINGSFGISSSALRAHSKALEAISYNIANISTEGFKAGEVRYLDKVGEVYNNSKLQHLNGTQPYYKQMTGLEGEFETTGNHMDLALSGIGMFVTSPNKTADTKTIELTDNGRLQLKQNPDGPRVEAVAGTDTTDPVPAIYDYYLADMKGNYMLGWPYNEAEGNFTVGTEVTSLQPIIAQADDMFYAATPTSTLEIVANLPAGAQHEELDANGNVLTPADTYNFGFDLYDGTGPTDRLTNAQDDVKEITTQFTKLEGINEWSLEFSLEDGKVDQDPVIVKFNSLGAIQSMQVMDNTDPAAPVLRSVVNDQFVQPLSIQWDQVAEAQTLNIDWSDITQFGDRPAQVTDFNVNGNLQGSLLDIKFDDNGVVSGQFDNGLSKPLAKLAIGDVVAMDSLTAVNATHYMLNDNTGALRLYEVDKTERATIIPDYFEGSTGDIGNEFTKMIVVQRAYSSAATTLRTQDEMMQTVTQIR